MPKTYKLGPRSLFPSTAVGASGGTYEGANLPQVTPEYNYNTHVAAYFSGGTTWNVTNAAEFQTALDNHVSGDIIELAAGSTYNSFFDFPNKGADHRCMIRTSAHASLPAMGTRVSPSDAANMPTLYHPNNDFPIFRFASGANGYYFVGLEVTVDNNTGSSTKMIELGERNNTAESEPYNLFMDRCYVHTPAGFAATRTITMCGRYIVLRDSYIYCAPYPGTEAQAIWATNSTGQWLIENNYIVGCGENFMCGGNTPPRGYDGIPRDVTFRYNYFFNPYYTNQTHPDWDGQTYVAKNLFELKYGRRFLIEWNHFEHWFKPDQDSWLNIKAVSQGGNFDEASTADIVFRYNSAVNVSGGIVLAGQTEGATGEYARLVIAYVRHSGISDPIYNNGSTSRNPHLRVWSGDDIRVLHCTFPGYSSHSVQPAGSAVCPRMHFRDNLVDYGQYGIKGTPGSGNNSIAQHMPDGVVTGNLFVGSTSVNYPAGNSLVLTYFDAEVEDPDTVSADYGRGDARLTTTSPYKAIATDGGEPGVTREVWAQLDAMEAAVIAGTPWSP